MMCKGCVFVCVYMCSWDTYVSNFVGIWIYIIILDMGTYWLYEDVSVCFTIVSDEKGLWRPY